MNKPISVEQPEQSKKRNPYTPWFVVIAFVAPVVAAYALFFLGITPPAFSNKGELLNPIIDVESFALTDDDNQSMSRDEITNHKWHMVYFAGASCDDACNQILYNMRQINIAVGKNANRLRRLLVHLEKPGQEFQALIAKEYPDAEHANANAATIAAALQEVGAEFRSNEVYIMDPLGNIMLRFTQDQPYKDLLHDLNKLFKVSQIG
ncbi:MAG: SCO family protein [Gammaproteobacteria bacterium]|nr:SCO family protein [Gammaproteobacteria bacterium]